MGDDHNYFYKVILQGTACEADTMKSEKTLEREEEKLWQENLREVLAEPKQKRDHGEGYGVASIVLGIIAFLSPLGLHIIIGIVGATFAVIAHHRGNKWLAIIGGAINILALLTFFILAGNRL
jgi:hypothetical protein